MSTAFHLALKEIWRGLGRFLLFSLVIALITSVTISVAWPTPPLVKRSRPRRWDVPVRKSARWLVRSIMPREMA